MLDNSFGPDLPFLNKKVKSDRRALSNRRAHIPRPFCLDKQASHTQVSDS